jgi:hypothetical protein
MSKMHLVGALGAFVAASGAVLAQSSRPPSNAEMSRVADWQAQAHRLAKLEQHVADLQNRVTALEDQVATENIVNQNLEIQIGILTRDTRHQR